MTKKQLLEIIRKVIKQELLENNPAPVTKPKPTVNPDVKPGKPGVKPSKPRRPLGNPSVKPGPKAAMNEEEMLKKIVSRFKSQKR